MIVEEFRPYQLLDTYDMSVLRTFRDQDKALQCLRSFIDSWGFSTCRTLNLLYVDENEEQTLLCYGNDPDIKDWYKKMQELDLKLRLAGTDSLGLDEFVAFSNLYPQWTESDSPLNVLDFERYNAHIGAPEIKYASGATRLQALANAFIGYTRITKGLK